MIEHQRTQSRSVKHSRGEPQDKPSSRPLLIKAENQRLILAEACKFKGLR